MTASFHYQDNTFFCEGVSAPSVVERFGTPVYVYSRAVILENFRRLQAGLSDISALICYSVKANSNLRILGMLHEVGAGFDIVSGGELLRVQKVGAPPEHVVFSGVGKTEAEVDAALAAGILMFNVESAGELELIEARARYAGRRAGVSMRVNPDVKADTHPYVATGQVIHKFGVPKVEALALYRRAAASSYLKILGVTCHIGSQILLLDPFMKALDEILGVAERLRTEGIEVKFLDLGGGYGIRYKDEQPLDVAHLTRELTARMREVPYQLILEPGRSLVAEAGILLTRVLYVKSNEKKSFVIVDAGMNDLLRPSLYRSYHGIVPVELRSEKTMLADVVGPICETGDFLALERELPEVRPGDLVAVMTVGAYGYVLSSNYNTRPRPAEVLVNGSEVQMIRRRESQDDLMAAELGL
ncbi:MAG TPA: diaminopimelate decarboxylase [Terriglobia bacterium]|nr:diaminopimelate decarboxylase [Terriglobia bacterium]